MPIHYSTSLREKRLSSLGLFMSISLNSTRPEDPGKILVMERMCLKCGIFEFWNCLVMNWTQNLPLYKKIGKNGKNLENPAVPFGFKPFLIWFRVNFDTSLGRPQLEERVDQQGVEFTLCHSLEEFSKTLEESPLWQFTITSKTPTNSLSKNWFTHTSHPAIYSHMCIFLMKFWGIIELSTSPPKHRVVSSGFG